ncbi:MAG TPA: helix-turn-helix domain-containing protein [Candidatus Kapabacteria bacterium]|nr:helix-turn-helix domain-containing protein [Candidatus Kapabacteria bacterium]
MQTENNLVERLTESKVYNDYERAFSDATGLPLRLRPVESWQLPHHGQRKENRFCAMLATKSRACAACLQVQQCLAETAQEGARTVTCAVGMSDTAVPVKLGDRVVGFLHTGQIFRKRPTDAQFEKVAQLAQEWGLQIPKDQLRDAWFKTRVMSQKEHDAVVRLLEIFADHLSNLSNQIVVQQGNAEPPMITKAKHYIRENQSEELSLGQVAKAVNASSFYFCKMFKKGTGVNFTEYVCRVRIESAKNLLLNPNLRISEIAYQVGFQSLTHFNRVFKKTVGEAPTEYRAKLKVA